MLKDQPKYWLPSDTLYVYLTKLPSNNKTRTLYPLWVDNRLFYSSLLGDLVFRWERGWR